MPVRFVIQLPPWFDRKLRLWAKVKGTARATLGANIIQSRIEANWDAIDKDLDAIAKERGITREQLEAEWLNGGEEGEEDGKQ